MDKVGYIYVLTNKSFHKDNWIKIGYTLDVDKRVKELSGTAVPLPYEVYCTYEIPVIKGSKDPDKFLHDIINKLNPDLRISPNREFYEMFPWDAYDMLFAIAEMHNRTEKLKRNDNNSSGKNIQKEYSIDALFTPKSEIRKLYEIIKKIIETHEASIEEAPRQYYVTYKIGSRNTVSLWPRSGWIEVVLNAKIGQIKDCNDLIYDISNRQWTSEQYAFKFYNDTDIDAVKNVIGQAIDLKIKKRKDD